MENHERYGKQDLDLSEKLSATVGAVELFTQVANASVGARLVQGHDARG
jgi:hypothetical protein